MLLRASVFKALIDAEETRRRSPTLSAYEMDPRLGGKWHLEVNQPHGGQKFIRHDGEIIEFDPPRLLVYTWLANFHKDPKRLDRPMGTDSNKGRHARENDA